MERIKLILQESAIFLFAIAVIVVSGIIEKELHWTKLLSLAIVLTACNLIIAAEKVNAILREFDEDYESLDEMLDDFREDNIALRDGKN